MNGRSLLEDTPELLSLYRWWSRLPEMPSIQDFLTPFMFFSFIYFLCSATLATYLAYLLDIFWQA